MGFFMEYFPRGWGKLLILLAKLPPDKRVKFLLKIETPDGICNFGRIVQHVDVAIVRKILEDLGMQRAEVLVTAKDSSGKMLDHAMKCQDYAEMIDLLTESMSEEVFYKEVFGEDSDEKEDGPDVEEDGSDMEEDLVEVTTQAAGDDRSLRQNDPSPTGPIFTPRNIKETIEIDDGRCMINNDFKPANAWRPPDSCLRSDQTD